MFGYENARQRQAIEAASQEVQTAAQQIQALHEKNRALGRVVEQYQITLDQLSKLIACQSAHILTQYHQISGINAAHLEQIRVNEALAGDLDAAYSRIATYQKGVH